MEGIEVDKSRHTVALDGWIIGLRNKFKGGPGEYLCWV